MKKQKTVSLNASLVFVILSLSSTALAWDTKEDTSVCADAFRRYEGMNSKPLLSPEHLVLMYKNQFCPRKIMVRRGDRVRWLNIENRTSHSVWFKDSGLMESERKFPEEYVDTTVDMPKGEHRYLCGPHWESGMVGILVVE